MPRDAAAGRALSDPSDAVPSVPVSIVTVSRTISCASVGPPDKAEDRWSPGEADGSSGSGRIRTDHGHTRNGWAAPLAPADLLRYENMTDLVNI